MAETLVLAVYVAILVALLVYGLTQLHLYRLHRRVVPLSPSPTPRRWPRVTIQLPVYNELYVVEQLLAAVHAIDYPDALLDIQLLDDSTDGTFDLAAAWIARAAGLGPPIHHVRRPDRRGFKAGALAYGAALSDAEHFAVFDADFIPARDFLHQTIPVLEADSRLAAVQVNWGFANEDANSLTRQQGFLLRMHFCLEQLARSGSGLFCNFNGTAGVWRATAVADAGGWLDRTITEDIDLSYRAQLAGWRIAYREEYACPSELPVDVSGFRSQQFRWIKGGGENARLHIPGLFAHPLPWTVRLHACAHLLAGSVYVLILALLILTVPMAGLKNSAIQADYVQFGIPFFAANIFLALALWEAQPAGEGGLARRIGAFLVSLVAFLVFTLGLSVHNGRAAMCGWLNYRTPFIRTPKFGARAETKGWVGTVYAARPGVALLLPELVLMLWLATGLAIGWARNEFALYPIQLMALAGLAWHCGLWLRQWCQHRRAHVARAAVGCQN